MYESRCNYDSDRGIYEAIEQERNRNYIPREPRINAIAQRELYMDSILNRGDRHCVEQIRMKPVVL